MVSKVKKNISKLKASATLAINEKSEELFLELFPKKTWLDSFILPTVYTKESLVFINTDDRKKQLLYLRANALASMYEAYCKK